MIPTKKSKNYQINCNVPYKQYQGNATFIEESGTNELNQPYYWFRLTEDNHGGIMAKFTENEIIREM